MKDILAENWTGRGCRFRVQIRTRESVSIVGEANDPFVALMHGKAEALGQMASGTGGDILTVEVVDSKGDIVLGEEASGLAGEPFTRERGFEPLLIGKSLAV